ncbi:MAG: ATP-binding protein, partial [Acidobacteriota bacterium]
MTAVKHGFPRRDDLIGVAEELAASVGASHAVIALDPERFAAGAVGSPGLPQELVDAAAAGPPVPAEELFEVDLNTSAPHGKHAQLMAKHAIGGALRVPLSGPGGCIGVAELYFTEDREWSELERLRLLLLAERAAMNVLNVRLFNLVERAKKEWEGTFDAIRDGISILDRNCRIRRANWGLGLMLGTRPSQLVGQSCHEAIFGRTERCAHCPMAESEPAATALEAAEHEDRIDGRVVRVSMYPLVLDDGGLSGVVHILRDVTQKVQEEAEFRRIHEELVRAHAHLTESMRQLKEAQAQLVQSEKMAAVGQLISGVAHELNNPLTGIIGYSQLIGGEEDISAMPAEKLQRFVGNMGREAQRCQKIVSNLLTFARRSDSEMTATSLNEVVERTVELKAYELRVSDISVELELDGALPRLRADPNQVQQVLLNLLHNSGQSIRSAAGKGVITIRSRHFVDTPPGLPSQEDAMGWIRLEVEDDGPGFSDDVRARVFDPFFTTKEVGEGTGLGLSICYGIVREHRGHISAENSEDGGARFVIDLPVLPAPSVDLDASLAEGDEASATGAESGAEGR